jgi:hypothetical protein
MPKHGRMKSIGTAVLALCLASGCRMPSERVVYRVAVDAVRAQPEFNDALRPASLRKAGIFVNKNAACVELPVLHREAGHVAAVYVIWCKRVARRWELDRIAPKPSYSES